MRPDAFLWTAGGWRMVSPHLAGIAENNFAGGAHIVDSAPAAVYCCQAVNERCGIVELPKVLRVSMTVDEKQSFVRVNHRQGFGKRIGPIERCFNCKVAELVDIAP